MSGDIADYVGRVVDISLFQGVSEGVNNRLEMSLLGEYSGLAITGAAKLAQRFFLEIMTERGSIPSEPSRGSDFMFEARTGRLRTTAEVEQSFYLALDQVRDDLIREESDDLPLDERYSGVTLRSVNLSNLELHIVVVITSRAGTSREVILPIFTRVGNAD